MNMTSYIPKVPGILAELRVILEGKTMVACLEHMKWLGAFICIEPVNSALIGAATTEEEAFALIQRRPPDFLIVSQRLESGHGLALVARAKHVSPAIRTLLVLDDEEHGLIERALGYGCDGICMKSESFMQALRVVAGGGIYYPADVARLLRQKSQLPMAEPLTRREVEVLRGLAMGFTDQEIARTLIISTETARSHVKHIYQKLQVSNRTQAVVRAIALGVVTIEWDEQAALVH